MKFSDINKKSDIEIQSMLLEKKSKLAKLRFDLSLKKIKNTAEIKEIKKDIAKILTIINKKHA